MLNTFGHGCSMEPLEGTDSANIPEPPRMEGFGSQDVMRSPFNYGSVEDGMLADNLEKKLRNQYWKAKQSVIEKLGKSQDEFVVAGDADIDTKLERAYHLGASCREMLQALDKYSQRLKDVTHYELLMGEHLRVWSETEYTNAGEVMQNVGKLQEEDAKARLGLITPLMRLHQESFTFRESAIRDLANSIHLLEKARSEYRAALLWMKDVSMKLQNPDYHNQLTKFRESQAAVKNTKHRFERLKSDLTEKINMVSASRSNLLSRLLPIYQKELLAFTDKWAGEYHKIMADLRSRHHHQYKLKNIMEEIRDLELQEAAAFELPPPDIGPGMPSTSTEQLSDNDEPLIDVGGFDPTSPPGQQQQRQQQQQSGQSFEDSLLTIEQEARVNDLQLSGIEAEFQEASSPQKQPLPPPSDNTPTATDKAEGDLLQLSPQHQASSDLLDSSPSDGQNQTDQLFDEWSTFSAFMPAVKSSAESGLSDWEKEFMQDTPSSTEDPFLGLDPLGSSSTTGQEKEGDQSALQLLESALNAPPSRDTPALPAESVVSTDSTLDELLGMGGEQQPQPKESTVEEDLMTLSQQQPITSSTTPSLLDSPLTQGAGDKDKGGLESLDLAYFQENPPPSSLQNPPLQQSGQPLLLPTTQQMHMLPITGPPMFQSPLTTSQGPIFPPQLPMGSQMPSGSGGAQPIPKRGAKVKEEAEKKGTSWMNVFAHLDPLVNEKV